MLQGAKLDDAVVRATDFRGAGIWQTSMPRTDTTGLADFTGLVLNPLSESDADAVKTDLTQIRPGNLRNTVLASMKPLMEPSEVRRWNQSPPHQQWQYVMNQSASAGFDYADRLTEHLSKSMCKEGLANGAIATGIARRAKTTGFRGNMVQLYDRLRGRDCESKKRMDPTVYRDFSIAAELARPK